MSHDAVVVGSGPNGLAGAITLAEAGLRVLVVEGAATPGGGLRTEESTLSGFRHDVCATVLPLTVASPVFRSMDLPGLGVRWCQPRVPYGQPLDGRPAAVAERSLEATAAGLGADADAWRALVGPWVRAADPLLEGLLDPLAVPPRHPVLMARFGPLALAPATWVARRRFRDEQARALFAGCAAHAVLDLHRPITTGVALTLALLAHHTGWPVAQGGSQAVADALVRRLETLGGTIETGRPVRDLGELPDARTVLLDVTPRQFLRIAGDRLPAGYGRRLDRYRYGPGVFKVDWALSGPVPWSDPRLREAGTVHVSGSYEETVASERDVARGRHPDRPFVLFVQPCVADPTRAPEGRHVGWAYCHVPHGSTVDMTEAVETQIERFAPGFRDLVLARHVTGPAAMEAANPNIVGGDIGGGVADVRQFFMRPAPSLTPWATPLPGVFLCSSSTPPGGGAHGMGGAHAARAALRRIDRGVNKRGLPTWSRPHR